jgi:hypothetical protein
VQKPKKPLENRGGSGKQSAEVKTFDKHRQTCFTVLAASSAAQLFGNSTIAHEKVNPP